jgi:hypothetical protein
MADESATLTPMADLAGRWGVTSNTVSRRLAFLGIKPIRQGNYRFITSEQVATADQLQDHLLAGKTMETFPRPDLAKDDGQIMRRVAGPVAPQVSGPVAGLVAVEQVAALAAALAAMKPADPLTRARGLMEAADTGMVLTSGDLEAMGVKGVSGWKDGHPAYGYRFQRHQAAKGGQVLWTVARLIGVHGGGTIGALPPGRRVGFAGDAIEATYRVIDGPSLPGFLS